MSTSSLQTPKSIRESLAKVVERVRSGRKSPNTTLALFPGQARKSLLEHAVGEGFGDLVVELLTLGADPCWRYDGASGCPLTDVVVRGSRELFERMLDVLPEVVADGPAAIVNEGMPLWSWLLAHGRFDWLDTLAAPRPNRLTVDEAMVVLDGSVATWVVRQAQDKNIVVKGLDWLAAQCADPDVFAERAATVSARTSSTVVLVEVLRWSLGRGATGSAEVTAGRSRSANGGPPGLVQQGPRLAAQRMFAVLGHQPDPAGKDLLDQWVARHARTVPHPVLVAALHGASLSLDYQRLAALFCALSERSDRTTPIPQVAMSRVAFWQHALSLVAAQRPSFAALALDFAKAWAKRPLACPDSKSERRSWLQVFLTDCSLAVGQRHRHGSPIACQAVELVVGGLLDGLSSIESEIPSEPSMAADLNRHAPAAFARWQARRLLENKVCVVRPLGPKTRF